MKILVLVKETFDTEAKIVLAAPDRISHEDIKFIINPFDEFAIEEAVRLKEKLGGEVVIVSLGREEAEPTLRKALAMGADRAVLIKGVTTDPLVVTQMLAETITGEERDFDLILAGWRAIDDNNAQIPGRLSQMLGIPFVNVVTGVTPAGRQMVCQRESDSGTEVIEVGLPALIAVQKGINEPRYPTMPNIMMAKRKPIKIVAKAAGKGSEAVFELPAMNKKGEIIDGADPAKAVESLVRKLREEAKVI
ncbi:MAG: electron transfer flavoprotein subunit beta/FixA family protein [Negativicutes bacterium]|nr:electron transfer flavoprotein subunit beta/FixA family protein [Negativicutes bacterium]